MDSAAVLDFPATLWVVDFANWQPGIVVLALAGPGLCERPIDRAGGWTICVHRALGPLAGPAGSSLSGRVLQACRLAQAAAALAA